MAKKSAGAGRGFVNPQRTDEPDESYVSPTARYNAEKALAERKESDANEAIYNKLSTVQPIKKAKGGMTASARADGCAARGKTKGAFV
jgi:hypothetical protein